MLYEYHKDSLSNYVKEHPEVELKRIQSEVSCAFKCLENYGIKVYTRIENIGVDQNGSVKLFVVP